ncbi:MAG: YtxH domain-containing protein, partial [Staphylococcus epidermidis]|nr:YtxH domain-containing protein [Staphylococcus epidermidis]
MEHYNRDNFEKSNTSEELYHRSSRSQSNSLKRKDFVVSFIASAIVGSAVGLYYKNKIYKKTDELKEKEQDLRSKVEDYKQRAEDTMFSVKSKVEQLKNDSKDNIHADELQAQKAAIQHETHLADESPEAQAIQEAKSEVDSNNKTSMTHIDSEKEPSVEEIAIAQTAVKEEARSHNLANPSASVEDTKSKSETETEKLAAATKAKRDKINNNNKVASNTKNLMQEESIKHSNNSDVPNLVTNLNQSQASDTNSVAYRLA